MSDIRLHRGDTTPIERTITVGGVAQNITGWSFLLTVNYEANPADTTNQLGQLVGVLTDAANGKVTFYPDATVNSVVGELYYDIEITDAAGYKTTRKGRWLVAQDITKSSPWPVLWEPNAAVADGTAYPTDASDFWVVRADYEPVITYETRDDTRVLRVMPTSSSRRHIDMHAIGATSEVTGIGPTGVYRYDLLVYATHLSRFELGAYEQESRVMTANMYCQFYNLSVEVDVRVSAPVAFTDSYDTITNNALSVPGWFRIAFEIDFNTHRLRGKVWEDAASEPTLWDVTADPVAMFPVFPMQPVCIAPYLDMDYGEMDFAWFKLEKTS